MTGDEYFHSRRFVPDGAALPGEPVVERDAPESRQQRRQRERQDAKAQRQRATAYMSRTGFNRLMPAGPSTAHQSTADRGKST